MPANLFSIAIFSVNVLLLLLLAVILYLVKKEKDFLEKNQKTPEVEIIKDARHKSETILERAISQAQNILTSAEKRGVKLAVNKKQSGDKITKEYEKEIAEMENNLKEKFEKSALLAKNTYQDFIDSIEDKIDTYLQNNQKLLETKTSAVIDKAKNSLTGITEEIEKKVKTQVDDEMAKVKGEIEDYKIHREKILDEKIIEILEEVLLLTVGKKLTLADQSEFVYKALEEAKKSHAFT